MRSAVQHAIGGYRADLPHSGDLEMWLRAALIADVGRVNGADQAYYRVHEQSMLHTRFSGWLVDLAARRDAFGSALGPDSPHRPQGADALLTRAGQALAKEALTRARRAANLGDNDNATVRAYLEFARDAYAPSARSRGWAAIERGSGRTGAGLVLARAGTRVASRTQESLRWHRWRWSGE